MPKRVRDAMAGGQRQLGRSALPSSSSSSEDDEDHHNTNMDGPGAEALHKENYGENGSSASSSDNGDGGDEEVDEGSFDEADAPDVGDDGNDDFGSEDSDDDDDEEGIEMSGSSDDDDTSGDGLIHVDFGVFDMKLKEVDAVIHLMDQLLPDKMNEVDRDDFGKALFESPFTSLVKLTAGSDDDNDNDAGDGNAQDDEDEEESEVYGMTSILDVASTATSTYKDSLGSLVELLRKNMWQIVAPGIPPVDILTAVDDATGRSKCVLLVSEYIRNVPLELVSQIVSKTIASFEQACLDRDRAKGHASDSGKKSGASSDNSAESSLGPLNPIFPCMFAVISKIQRAVDAPSRSAAASDNARKKQQHPHKKSKAEEKQSTFNMEDYIFWREEDSIMYEYRDKRIATAAYRCRAQYDGQPENDIPLSIMYVLSFGGFSQSMSEIAKRESTEAKVTTF